MTNFENSVNSVVADYLKSDNTKEEIREWSIEYIKHLSKIRRIEDCVKVVMDSIKRNG